MPREDNTFGGGNYDADDLEEWLTVQRDWQVDAGIEPVSEDEVLAVRGGRARRPGRVRAAGLPAGHGREVEAATSATPARDVPDRDRAADVLAADRMIDGRASPADVTLALDAAGFSDVAEAVRGNGAPASGARTTSRPRR